MNKIWFLINPPTGNYIRDTRCQASIDDAFAIFARSPVDLAYSAAEIEKSGDKCFIKDYPAEGLAWNVLLKDLATLNVDYVMINTTIYTYEDDLKVCEECKRINNNIVTIAKGTVFYNNVNEVFSQYPYLDIAITNDEEKVLGEMALSSFNLEHINNVIYRKDGKVIINKKYISDSFELPIPKLEQIKHELYRRPDTNEKQATIVVGRGCPGNCIYCVAPMVGGKVARYRDIEDVITEIKEYYYKYGISNFYFSADTFTWNNNWVKLFCTKLAELEFKISWVCTARADRITNELILEMKNTGCWGVSIGVESGNEFIQKKINKNLKIDCIRRAIAICRKHRIVTLLHFIIGFPCENEKMITENIKFARKLRGNIIEFYIATPLPGTTFYDIVRHDNRLTLIDKTKGLNQKVATTATYYVSSERLEELRKKAIRSIYFNPLFYINSLLYIRSFSQFAGCFIFVCKKFKKIFLNSRADRVHLNKRNNK